MTTQIRPTTWPELENNISRLGYRYPAQIKQQLGAVRSIFTAGVLCPYVAQIPGSPPLVLVKGPLFGPTDPAVPRGAPPVEFVVTLAQDFPNAYPIITIELPPEGNVIKNHPNVNNQGCVFLQSIASWNPRGSQLDACLKELYVAFKNNFPFVPVSQRPAANAPPAQHLAMPQQTLAMGARITSALAATVAPPRPQPQPQPQPQLQPRPQPAPQPPMVAPQQFAPPPPPPQQQQAVAQQQVPLQLPPVQQRPANLRPAYEGSEQYDFNKGDFEAMLAGIAKPPGQRITPPQGFGLKGLVTSTVNLPMRIDGQAPYPLPPVTTPTPDEQYRLTVATAEARRAVEAQNAVGFGGFLKSVKGAAASVKNAVEDKVRETVKHNDAERFNKLFPTMRHEQLLTTYECATLLGNGTRRKGIVFVTVAGVHFTTKPPTDPRPDDPPRPPDFTCSIPLRGIVSIALGRTEGSRKWIHLCCIDGSVRSFFDVTSGWTDSAAANFASASLNDTPFDRLYNWLDHAWRPTTAVPNPSYPYDRSVFLPSLHPSQQQQQQQFQQPMAQPQFQPQLQPQPVMYRSSPSTESPPAQPSGSGGCSSAPLPPPTTSSSAAAAATGAVSQTVTTSCSVADDIVCCICLERPKSCFFRPCGHVCACMECGTKVGDCPMCRAKITETLQAFL